jgi:diguanylate cyclase (GGDEF)-like protein
MTTESFTDPELDAAFDAIAAALRAVAKHPMPIDAADQADLAERCERWAKHVLVLGPSPGSNGMARRRDWRALTGFVQRSRASEAEQVGRSVAGLRDVLWELLFRIQGIVTGGREDDGAVRGQVEALRQVIASPSPERVREEVGRVASELERVVEDRIRKQEVHLSALSGQLRSISSELEEATKAASEDALTRTHNRRAFDDYVGRCALFEGLCGRPTWLLMIDVDHFKKVNDDFGHPAGDEVLQAVGRVLAKAYPRRSDFVARYGGEVFAVILREVSLADLEALAQRTLRGVREIECGKGDRARRMSVSIGAAALEAGEAAASWVLRADQALYAAKHGGRDRLVVARASGSPSP